MSIKIICDIISFKIVKVMQFISSLLTLRLPKAGKEMEACHGVLCPMGQLKKMVTPRRPVWHQEDPVSDELYLVQPYKGIFIVTQSCLWGKIFLHINVLNLIYIFLKESITCPHDSYPLLCIICNTQ